jgi:hypothetical protein
MEAVDLARSIYGNQDIVMAPDYNLPNTDIGIKGFEDIGGITDYAFGPMNTAIPASIILSILNC